MGKFFIVIGVLVLVLSVYVSKIVREELSAVPADAALQKIEPVEAAASATAPILTEKAKPGSLTHAQERLTNRVLPVQERNMPDSVLPY